MYFFFVYAHYVECSTWNKVNGKFTVLWKIVMLLLVKGRVSNFLVQFVINPVKWVFEYSASTNFDLKHLSV